MNNIIFVSIILFLLLIILYFKNLRKNNDDSEDSEKLNNKEQFVSNIYNETILRLNVIESKKPIITIYKDKYDNSVKLDRIQQKYNNIKIKDFNDIISVDFKSDNNPSNLYYTDVYSFNKKCSDKFKAVTLCTIPKSLLLISKSTNIKLTRNNNKLTIGYFNEIDKEICQNIIKSQNKFITMDHYEFKLINNINEELFNLKRIDIFVYYNTLSNPIFDEIKKNDFNLVSYNDFNKDLLQYYFPFYRRKIFTIDNSVDKNLIHNTLQIDTILFTKKEDETFNNNYLELLNYFDEYLKINYYIQYFNFTKISKDWSLEKQESIKHILETFENENGNQNNSMLFIINQEVDILDIIKFQNNLIVSNNDITVYRVDITELNNQQIIEGDRILFTNTNQIPNFQVNKVYYVAQVEDDHILIENAKKFELNDEVVNVVPNQPTEIQLQSQTIEENNLQYGDNVYIIDYGLGIVIKRVDEDSAENVENLFVLLEDNNEIEQNNTANSNEIGGEYVTVSVLQPCTNTNPDTNEDTTIYDYENSQNTNQTIYDIENTYNEIQVTEWNTQCVQNEECPFYLANQNFPNNDGGCINGYCQFPIGLTRIGYKTYYNVINENNYPRCRGCEDDNIYCCQEQGNSDEYNGPNYIFATNI